MQKSNSDPSMIQSKSDPKITEADKIFKEIRMWAEDVLLKKYRAELKEFAINAGGKLLPLHTLMVENMPEGSELTKSATLIDRTLEKKYPQKL